MKPDLDIMMMDYLYGELSASERASFEAHMTSDPALKAEVASHQLTIGMVSSVPEPTPAPQAIFYDIMRQARAAAAPVAPERSLFERIAAFLMQPAVATAALVLVVAVTGLYIQREGDHGHGTATERTAATVSSASGESLDGRKMAVAEQPTRTLEDGDDEALAFDPPTPATAAMPKPTPLTEALAAEVADAGEVAGLKLEGASAAGEAPSADNGFRGLEKEGKTALTGNTASADNDTPAVADNTVAAADSNKWGGKADDSADRSRGRNKAGVAAKRAVSNKWVGKGRTKEPAELAQSETSEDDGLVDGLATGALADSEADEEEVNVNGPEAAKDEGRKDNLRRAAERQVAVTPKKKSINPGTTGGAVAGDKVVAATVRPPAQPAPDPVQTADVEATVADQDRPQPAERVATAKRESRAPPPAQPPVGSLSGSSMPSSSGPAKRPSQVVFDKRDNFKYKEQNAAPTPKRGLQGKQEFKLNELQKGQAEQGLDTLKVGEVKEKRGDLDTAMAHYRGQRYGNAIKDFKRYLDKNQDPDAEANLARSYKQSNKLRDSLGHYRTLLVKFPKYRYRGAVLIETANLETQLGELEAARAHLVEAARDPKQEKKAKALLVEIDRRIATKKRIEAAKEAKTRKASRKKRSMDEMKKQAPAKKSAYEATVE